jgi:ketose-bisphosphate aldolase
MLTTLKEVTQDALRHHYAVGAYNIHNLEYAKAVVETSCELNAPVILQISQGSSDFAGLEELSMIALHYAAKYPIPVVVHLDHGKSFLRCIEGLRAGFSSVMFDGSSLPYDDNVAVTRQVVEAAHQVGVAVEAEIGKVGKSEDGEAAEAPDMHYTTTDEAVRFFADTQVDALAVSIGTVHAMAVQAAHLDVELCRRLHEAMPAVPLVMHGASGAVDEDVRQVIQLGVTKINIATYLQKQAALAVKAMFEKNPDAIGFRDLAKPQLQAIREGVRSKIELFETANRA